MCIVYSYCGVMMGSFVSMWFDSPRSFFSFVFSSHRSAAALGRGFTSALHRAVSWLGRKTQGFGKEKGAVVSDVLLFTTQYESI